jgi:multidrug resistance protein, MATE family
MIISYKQHFEKTLNLAYPVIIGQLGHVMFGVVDSFMLGKVGAVPLAASAIGNSIFFLIFIFGLGISFAISPIVAISLGAKREDDFNNILRHSFILNITVGIILTIVVFISADLIKYLNQPKDVAYQAAIFLRIIGLSLVPLMIFQTFKQSIEGLSIMLPAMIITILANIVNYVGNWLLIFGNAGFPKLGLSGSGFSTLITRIAMAATIFIYVFYAKRFKIYNLSMALKKIDISVIKKLLNLGIPTGVQYLFETAAFAFSTIMIGWLGTKALAAHQIAINLASITYMAATGISAAAAIRVGNAVGTGSIVETRRSGFSALLLCMIMMLCFAVVFIVFNKQLPLIYIKDYNVIPIASSLIIIGAFFQVFDGSQAVGLGMLRGLTDVKIPTLITFSAYWVIMIPCCYFLAFVMKLGVQGIWLGFIFGLAFSAIMLNIRFYKRSKEKIHL